MPCLMVQLPDTVEALPELDAPVPSSDQCEHPIVCHFEFRVYFQAPGGIFREQKPNIGPKSHRERNVAKMALRRARKAVSDMKETSAP